jgi:MurNAc alpha-1-phosphate uridylyltransferase
VSAANGLLAEGGLFSRSERSEWSLSEAVSSLAVSAANGLSAEGGLKKKTMKAMIFAAGLGTRLRPLTNDRPKAMVEINGMPLLEIIIRRLRHYGYREIIVNVHHYSEMIIDFLKEKKHFGIDISVSDETGMVLETGGGLQKASWFFEDGAPFLVHNVDILTDLNYHDLMAFHHQNKAIATLATRNRTTSRYLLFNNKNVLSGWKNIKTEEVKMSRGAFEEMNPFAFSGIHIIDPKLFTHFTRTGKFSIIDTYLDVAKTEIIAGFDHSDGIWLDVGKPDALAKGRDVLEEIKVSLE